MSNRRTRPSQTFGVPHSPAYRKHLKEFAYQREVNKLERRRKRLQELETEYHHLPPLPARLPRPLYVVQGKLVYQTHPSATAFYNACSEGWLKDVSSYVQTSQPPAADLAYALEKASHNFQLEVVRVLLQQPDTKLHYRCFRRCPDSPDDNFAKDFDGRASRVVSQSIFTSGHSRLLDLLKIFLEFGWHPNQLLGLPEKLNRAGVCLARHEVTLHYPRCILDLDVLRFLLDAGADPTIARNTYWEPWFDSLHDQPVQRLSGDILELAVNLGDTEAATLLMEGGARPAYGIPLHSLARRRPDSSEVRIMDDTSKSQLWQETPELEYPNLSPRLPMAGHLLQYGEDINRVVNVYPIVGQYCQISTRRHSATALSHAKNSMDWDFVKWLLEHGAQREANIQATFYAERIYAIGPSQDEIEKK